MGEKQVRLAYGLLIGAGWAGAHRFYLQRYASATGQLLLTVLMVVLWIVYGSFSSFGTLSYAVLSAGFPASLSGRIKTTYNLTSFVGAFAFQWGIGLLIDWQRAQGLGNSIAHRNAFIVVLVCQVLAIVWLLIPDKREKAA